MEGVFFLSRISIVFVEKKGSMLVLNSQEVRHFKQPSRHPSEMRALGHRSKPSLFEGFWGVWYLAGKSLAATQKFKKRALLSKAGKNNRMEVPA